MITTHPFLHQARRDLDRAEANKAKAEAMLRSAEQEIVRLQHFIEQYELYAGEESRDQEINKMRIKSRTITDTAISIIEKSEDPMSIQEILDALYENGIGVGGGNKAANLAAYLSKDNRVRYERGLGWMLSAHGLFEPGST